MTVSGQISDDTIARAVSGDTAARETLVRAIADDVYGLAVRMLGHPADAEDATQEVLLRVLRKLPTFRGDSALRTWVYRVASNHLLSWRESRVERAGHDFARAGEQLDGGLAAAAGDAPSEDWVLVREVKVFCTQGMLLCLDREHRLAYVLGEILELSGREAASILELPDATYRKRLSRARQNLTEFMQVRCGLVDPANACRCGKLVPLLVRQGILDPDRPLFTSRDDCERAALLEEQVDALRSAAEVFRSHPDYSVSDAFIDRMREVVAAADLGN